MTDILLPFHASPSLDLLDVEHRDSSIINARGLIVVLVLFSYVIVVCVVSAVLGLSPWVTVIAAPVVVFGAGIVYAVAAQRITRARAARLANLPGASLTAAAVEAFLRANRLWAPTDATVFLAQALGATHKGKAIRVGPPRSLPPVLPLTVQFEPMNLNETEAPFRQVAAHANDEGVEADTIDSSDKWAVRGLLRNMRLTGGLALPLLWLSLGLLLSYRSGRITWLAGLFFFSLAMSMLGSGNFGSGATQILAVPGGLLARSPLKQGGWGLRLFTPVNSVVCCRYHSKHRWELIVSDGQDVVRAAGTIREMTFALQAWYSPLTPPSLDRLSDWT